MDTKLRNLFGQLRKQFLEKTERIEKLGFALSLLVHFFGFFLGNVVSTWLSLFFEWNGIAALVVLFLIEFISFVEYNPKIQNPAFLKYASFLKRGFFFGLLADGFKVGS